MPRAPASSQIQQPINPMDLPIDGNQGTNASAKSAPQRTNPQGWRAEKSKAAPMLEACLLLAGGAVHPTKIRGDFGPTKPTFMMMCTKG